MGWFPNISPEMLQYHGTDWEDTGQKVVESEELEMKTFEVTADMLASCVFKIQAKTELEAKRLFEEGNVKHIGRKKTKWVTSPIITNIKEIH